LNTDAVSLPDLRKMPRVEALNMLGNLSTKFKITEQTVEAAPASNLEHCIKDQKPAEGTWVSREDRIQLWTYDVYSTVTLNGRVISDGPQIKPVAGAQVEIEVGQYRGVATSDATGKFQLKLIVSPRVVNEGLPFTVRVRQPGFFLFQEQMSRTENNWVIRLKPNVEPVISMRMGRVKARDEAFGSIPASGWVYEVLFTVKNASVRFTAMDTQENTQNGSVQDDSCDIYLRPGPEQPFVFRTSLVSLYNRGDASKLQQKVTLKGADENGVPRMYTFLFDAARHAVAQQQNTNQFTVDDLFPRYLEAYNSAVNSEDAMDALDPIEAAYKGEDHLVFVKKLMEKKSPKLIVTAFPQLDRNEFTKMCYLVRHYIYKTIVTGDQRYELKAQLLLRTLSAGKKMFVGLVPAWTSEQVRRRAQELAPEFFGN
jgi:hypothetical protein